jgi:hypothetical protein
MSPEATSVRALELICVEDLVHLFMVEW